MSPALQKAHFTITVYSKGGSPDICFKEADQAHGRPRLQGCRTCVAWLPSRWHTQQKSQQTCHGQMGLNAVWPFPGRRQGRLPEWSPKLFGTGHDLRRWTPPVSHVYRIGEAVQRQGSAKCAWRRGSKDPAAEAAATLGTKGQCMQAWQGM